MSGKIVLLGAMMALATTTVAAQEPPRTDSARVSPRVERGRARLATRRTPGARVRVDASPARALLGQRERLQLTEEQMRRLEALAREQRESVRPNEPALLRARADLMDAVQRDNIAGARAAMERMSRLRTDATVARLEARKQARDILTAEQRTRVDEARRMTTGRGRMSSRPDRRMRGFDGGKPGLGLRSRETGPRVGPSRRFARPPRERRF
jgi:Spy/CpxP family protein refolding chaperone